MTINWEDPNDKVSVYFTVKEALLLPQWNRIATEKDGLGPDQKANLVKLMKVMDTIRTKFNKPVIVHVTFRSYSYNKLIGGAPNSSHVQGMACDFHVDGMSCDDVRAALVPKLDEYGIRMEKLEKSPWVHIDIKPCDSAYRYFIP